MVELPNTYAKKVAMVVILVDAGSTVIAVLHAHPARERALLTLALPFSPAPIGHLAVSLIALRGVDENEKLEDGRKEKQVPKGGVGGLEDQGKEEVGQQGDVLESKHVWQTLGSTYKFVMHNHCRKLFATTYRITCSMYELSLNKSSSTKLVSSVWQWYRQFAEFDLQSISLAIHSVSSFCFSNKCAMIVSAFIYSRTAPAFIYSRTAPAFIYIYSFLIGFYYAKSYSIYCPSAPSIYSCFGEGRGSGDFTWLFFLALGRGLTMNLRRMSKFLSFLYRLRGSALTNTIFFLIFISRMLIQFFYKRRCFPAAVSPRGQFLFRASIHFRISSALSITAFFALFIGFRFVQYSSEYSEPSELTDRSSHLSYRLYSLSYGEYLCCCGVCWCCCGGDLGEQ